MATAALGKMGNGEGERQGACEVSAGSGRQREACPGVHGRGRQAGGAVASSGSSASPLCLPGEDEAAGWHGPAQCWACQVGCGQVSGPGKISLSLSLSLSLIYCFCFLLFLYLLGFIKNI